MKSVEKAIWYIESHYGQKVTLDDLAKVACISRYHLSREFGYSVGIPISRYLRDRRLSQAAHSLAAGESNILNLALSLGYHSHEAFSRAFKSRFGQTPESIRTQGHTDNLDLLEATRMTNNHKTNLSQPRIVRSDARLLVGLSRKYLAGDNAAIPGQWQEFAPLIESISLRVPGSAFGVVYNMDEEDNHEYLCAVEVKCFDDIPDELARLRLPEQSYAVFQHARHVSEIKSTCVAIWTTWLPESGYKAVDSPFFERYLESFDPESGVGGMEVWLPIAI